MTRHFLSVGDLSPGDLSRVLDLSEAAVLPPVLAGRGTALVFEHPSARTRNAAEMAVVQLGGHPVVIQEAEIGLDRRETAEDVARTLGRYHAAIGARVGRHALLERMAGALDDAGARVPVVNLLSDREHPTQALADVLTLRQHFAGLAAGSQGPGGLTGRVLAFVGDANNVCRSLAGAAALLGMEMRVASPDGYELRDADADWAAGLGERPRRCETPAEAVEGADAIYTDVWVSMGQHEEAWARRRAFAAYTVDDQLLAGAAPHAVVMHCLPAHRGEEITAGVLDGPRAVVWRQAENRMHALRGLLAFLLGAADAREDGTP